MEASQSIVLVLRYIKWFSEYIAKQVIVFLMVAEWLLTNQSQKEKN